MKQLVAGILLCLTLTTNSQEATKTPSVYQFTKLKDNAAGAIENQCATGTCWSFATVSFLESEIIRKGNKPVDLSEMYNVWYCYTKKADAFVRYQGGQQFGPGGLSHDVIAVMSEHGIIPESVFTGLPASKKEYDHKSLDALLESTVKTVLDKKLYEENNDWKSAVEGILNGGIGNLPDQFDYEGKKYTPATFRDAMKLNPADYVSVTSFTHHPFYSQFVLEVPDNWAKRSFYNLPLDELQKVLDNAIDNGYTIAWDADVSEKGFSFKNGLAIIADDEVPKEDIWTKVVKEKTINQEYRQSAFDQFKTTDDHLMHITGKAKDQNGNIYYTTKNSWGIENPYGGYQYISKNYFQMKTVGMMIHKDAIPKELRVKMGIS